jgi:hypothetical protein
MHCLFIAGVTSEGVGVAAVDIVVTGMKLDCCESIEGLSGLSVGVEIALG